MSAKFFKLPIWADRLIALGEGLASRKQDIEFALSIHTAVGVDSTRATVDRLDLKIDKLVAIVECQSRREQDLESMIAELGGRELVMGDPSNLELAAEKIVQRTAQENQDTQSVRMDALLKSGTRPGELKEAAVRITPVKKAAEVATNKSGPKIVNPSVRRALSTSLDALLEKNSRIYGLKLQEQTRQIRDALDASTQ